MDAALLPYLDRWYLSGPELIVATPTCDIYRVLREGKARALKLYTTAGKIHEAKSAGFLALCAGQGTVQIYGYDEGAALIDYIDGPTLTSMVKVGKDDQATKNIAHILNLIHGVAIPPSYSFKTLRNHMEALFTHETKRNAPALIKRAAPLALNLLSTQGENFLLHGDMHHDNIMQHREKGWIAIDPHSLVGERAYDCANVLYNPLSLPELTENTDRLTRQVQILSRKMGIDPQRIIDYAFVHGCLSACWSKDDTGQYDEARLRTSALLEPLTSMNNTP